LHFSRTADWGTPRKLLAAVGLAVAIGASEYATGYDFHLAALFLVPVCWAGWAAGRRAGLCLALFSTLVWLAADLLLGHPYKHPAIPYWNALMLLVFFGLIAHLLCAFKDAHLELLEAQSQLRSQNEGLEEAVRQRTAALRDEIAERKRLEQAKLQAERLAMVGAIAAQVAHEVRNPLGSITLNLDLIAREIETLAAASHAPAQEARALVPEMREEVRRIQHVLEDYLRFARLPKFQREHLKLNEFLLNKLAFMEAAFQKARVRLRTELDPAVASIDADPEQLWQAVLNLLQNGVDAMPAGGELTVGTHLAEEETLLRVADTGKGMTRQQQERLFEPFFTTKPHGTGLGLSLAQRILNEHGARIECASALGKGTAFTIHFPTAPRP
jgi:signal transduction histidine kinase